MLFIMHQKSPLYQQKASQYTHAPPTKNLLYINRKLLNAHMLLLPTIEFILFAQNLFDYVLRQVSRN